MRSSALFGAALAAALSLPPAASAQVRRPIYKTSAERWRRYEAHIGPLLEALGDLVPR